MFIFLPIGFEAYPGPTVFGTPETATQYGLLWGYRSSKQSSALWLTINWRLWRGFSKEISKDSHHICFFFWSSNAAQLKPCECTWSRTKRNPTMSCRTLGPSAPCWGATSACTGNGACAGSGLSSAGAQWGAAAGDRAAESYRGGHAWEA